MGHSDSSASMRMGHMEELFLEADANLKEVRLGAENVALDAAGELAETHGDVVDRRMKQRLGKNPLFRELMDYMEAVAMGLKTEDKRVLETGVAHFDSVLAASLKTMMREVTFSRNDLQRQTSLSRVHAWFQDKLKARNALRERAGFPSDNAVFRDEQKNEKRSRRDRYENQMNNNRPSTSGRAAAGSGSAAAAAARSMRKGNRPTTAPVSSNDFDNVKLTGRLQIGGIKMRNLFASQRRRILKAQSMSRAEQRRMIGQIADAQQAHTVDVEESTNMYSYLIGNSGSKSRPGTGVRKSRARDTKARPSTAGATNRPSSRQASKRMGGGRPPQTTFTTPTGTPGSGRPKRRRWSRRSGSSRSGSRDGPRRRPTSGSSARFSPPCSSGR